MGYLIRTLHYDCFRTCLITQHRYREQACPIAASQEDLYAGVPVNQNVNSARWVVVRLPEIRLETP